MNRFASGAFGIPALATAGIVAGVVATSAQSMGPSTLQSAYAQPAQPTVSTMSILSVGDEVSGYRMAGIPDGLGAFDNGDSTFTLLMNHEVGNTAGAVHAHGSKGAFVSKWVIDKDSLQVMSGQDLMKQIYPWDAATQKSATTPGTYAFTRFCSGDLPDVTAFYNPSTGRGTRARIYMHGEEGGTTGYQLGSVVTGPSAGKTYVLGKFNLSTNGSGLTGIGAWENALASPYPQDKTIVIANSDGGTGLQTNAVAVYVGTKRANGSEVDKAGLTNGTLSFVNVVGNRAEIVDTTTRATTIVSGTRFTLSSTASTTFSRPEDGAWSRSNPNQYYFVTTDQLDQATDGVGAQNGRTRLWRLTFDDIKRPERGGKIDLLVNGRIVDGERVNMFDNVALNPASGLIVVVEDVGGAAHNGKTWLYDPQTGELMKVAHHDVSRFGDIGIAATAPFNQDEESSGVIDMSAILGPGSYLLVDQSHYLINAASPRGFTDPDDLVEGGQLLYMRLPFPIATTKSQCKDGGWEWSFREDGDGFKTLAECNRYVGNDRRGGRNNAVVGGDVGDDSRGQGQDKN